jgi:hypothetical protein
MLRVSRRTWVVSSALLVAIAILVVCGACGESLPTADEPILRPETGPDKGTSESSTDTDAGTDSALDAKEAGRGDGGCLPQDSYGDAAPLEHFEGLGSVSSVRISREGGAVYLSHDQGGQSWFDIGESEYPLPPGPMPASIRNTDLPEENPAPLADDKTVFWDQTIDGGARRIYSWTRSGPGQNLEGANPEDIPRNGKTQALMPWVVGDTQVLYFVIRNAANNTAGIYRGVRSGPTWNITTELDEAPDETHPVVSDDETVMYFAQSLSGGRRQIHYVTRSGVGAPWSAPLPVEGDVNLPDSDSQPTWISPDQCTLIFTSNRVASSFKPYKIVRVRP